MILDFADRLLLALEGARLQYERRDGFISDDDLLDLADEWTTDTNETYLPEYRADYSALVDALFESLTAEEA